MNLKNKGIGVYFGLIAAIVGIVGLVRFLSWAPAHNGMDMTIAAALVAGVVVEAVLLFKEIHVLKVVAVACFTYPAARLIANSVGSIVDKMQGINMFGDATQVDTIVSITITMAVAAVIALIASFMAGSKE